MKKIIFISNDFAFLPVLKELKRNYAGSVEYFMHSEEKENPHAFDMRSISKINEYLSDADFVVPLFDGIIGVYLLQILFTSLPTKKPEIIHIENALVNYLKENFYLFPVETSVKETFEKHIPNAPAFQYVLLENKIPAFLSTQNSKAILKDLIVKPYNLLELLVENILAFNELPESKVVLNSLPDDDEIEMMSEYLSSQIERRSIVEKFHDLFDSKFSERRAIIYSLKSFLSDLAQGKNTNNYELRRNYSFSFSKSVAY